MKRIVVSLAVILISSIAVWAQKTPPAKPKTMTAKGTFDVKTIPQPADDAAAGPFGRLFLDKKFQGDIEAVSKGQMMGAQTET